MRSSDKVAMVIQDKGDEDESGLCTRDGEKRSASHVEASFNNFSMASLFSFFGSHCDLNSSSSYSAQPDVRVECTSLETPWRKPGLVHGPSVRSLQLGSGGSLGDEFGDEIKS